MRRSYFREMSENNQRKRIALSLPHHRSFKEPTCIGRVNVDGLGLRVRTRGEIANKTINNGTDRLKDKERKLSQPTFSAALRQRASARPLSIHQAIEAKEMELKFCTWNITKSDSRSVCF